jgi:hypothetical protein
MQNYPKRPLATKENMLDIIGPIYCNSLLLTALASCGDKLHWGVNTYFRNDLTLNAYKFEDDKSLLIRQKKEDKEIKNKYNLPSNTTRNHALRHHFDLMQRIMSFLNFRSLKMWSSCCVHCFINDSSNLEEKENL